MIGVGGIGSGKFFLLNGNQTIGREESRGGDYLDQKDYCKLHIIAHYVKVLLGINIKVIPIGKVGNDDVGDRLLNELSETGFTMDYMDRCNDSQTLFSFCFLYPDGTGGNLTTSNSACSKVDALFVRKAQPEFIRFKGKGIALIAPEVPMDAREELLKMGTEFGFFRVASFTSEEMQYVIHSNILTRVDLLAINLEEASAAINMSIEKNDPIKIVETSINKFADVNPDLLVSITHGKKGSWSWDGRSLSHVPIHHVNVKNTAGAGDAHFAGIIVGLTVGYSLQEAHQLGALVSSYSVTSQHTIHKELNRESIFALAKKSKTDIGKNLFKFLEE